MNDATIPDDGRFTPQVLRCIGQPVWLQDAPDPPLAIPRTAVRATWPIVDAVLSTTGNWEWLKDSRRAAALRRAYDDRKPRELDQVNGDFASRWAAAEAEAADFVTGIFVNCQSYRDFHARNLSAADRDEQQRARGCADLMAETADWLLGQYPEIEARVTKMPDGSGPGQCRMLPRSQAPRTSTFLL